VSVDVNAFEPGDEWAEALPSYIGEADVFYLMRSDNAAGYKWVGMKRAKRSAATTVRRNIGRVSSRSRCASRGHRRPNICSASTFSPSGLRTMPAQAVGLVQQDVEPRSLS
jgi:hypothetical protein